jgi:hypothetical protein
MEGLIKEHINDTNYSLLNVNNPMTPTKPQLERNGKVGLIRDVFSIYEEW